MLTDFDINMEKYLISEYNKELKKESRTIQCRRCNNTNVIFISEDDTEGIVMLKCRRSRCRSITTISQERFEKIITYHPKRFGKVYDK